MALTWMSYLETGIEWMDTQHKELFKRINTFLEAMSKSRGKDEVANLLTFLDSYVVLHFGSEEQAMKRSDYPDSEFHKREHERFKAEIAAIKKELETGGIDLVMVIKVQERLVDWLMNHIGKVDKRLGGFLRQHGEAL